ARAGRGRAAHGRRARRDARPAGAAAGAPLRRRRRALHRRARARGGAGLRLLLAHRDPRDLARARDRALGGRACALRPGPPGPAGALAWGSRERGALTAACLGAGACLAWAAGRPGAGGGADLFGGRARREALLAWTAGARRAWLVGALVFAALVALLFSSFTS